MFNAKAFMEGRSAFANLKDSKSFLLVALLILIGQYLIVTFGGEMFSVIPLSLKDWAILSDLPLWFYGSVSYSGYSKDKYILSTCRDGTRSVSTTENSTPI